MGESEVCLKWNTFHQSIASSFELLWEEENLVDVTLAAGDQIIYAHKIILSACSPFFKQLFEETSCKHPLIILPEINMDDLRMLLNFIYKGEVYIIEDNLPEFLRLAEYLQIRGLWKPVSTQTVDVESLVEPSIDNDDNMLNKNMTNLHAESNQKSFNEKDSDVNEEPSPKRFRNNPTNYSYSPLSDFGTIIPNCKAEIKEFDKELYAVVDEQFSNSLFQWQKASSQSLLDNKKTSHFNCNTLGNEQEVRLPYMSLPYADLLPSPITLQMWAQNRTLDQFACDLMKMLFSTEERIICNVNGKMGKLQFNVNKINLIREVIQSFSNLSPQMFEEQWKICVTKIDTANRGLKRRFKSKDVVFCDRNF